MSNVVGKLFGFHFAQANVPQLVGKRFVVTGGTNGIGLSVARTLYSHGAEVVILGSQESTADAAEEYIKTGDLKRAPKDYQDGFAGIVGDYKDDSADGGNQSGEVSSRVVDFKDLKAVSKVGKELAEKYDRLDGFLGIAGLGVNKFTLTADGYDAHLTVNCLSHLLLLSYLLPNLEKTSRSHPDADVRIVLMSSELHRNTFGGPSENWGGNKFRDAGEFAKDVGPANLYARSKVGQTLIAKALVQRYLQPPSKLLAYSTHPGAVATGQTRQYNEAYGDAVGGAIQAAVRPLMRAPDEGALSVLWAATSAEARTGGYKNGEYFTDPAQEGKPSSEATDQELIDNFYNTGLEIIKKIVGPDGVGHFST
ncbi:short-chain dehydrogenase/reductase SDR family protein [Rhodotorula toruloides]|uniref:Short-chain dehydrogenase/reductase SDR family protein n=1 Tax=Rhodotorula toruloides TaxID=5286 RepID=A0A511KPR3_RHOTO|nr:short-chain dehydrogenase/reductase SDR family protein [Rhodotorula toruloides]